MEIKGNQGHLTPAEMAATGLPSPVPLADIDGVDLLARLDERRQGLEAMQAADDDELTHAERASIAPEQFLLAVDTPVIKKLVGQTMAHQVELFLIGDN